MTSRRQYRADCAAAEERATKAEKRARDLTAELDAARESLTLANARGGRMASRIIQLSRQLRTAQQGGEVTAP